MMQNIDPNLTTAYTNQPQATVDATMAAPPVAPASEAEKSARNNQQDDAQQQKQDDKLQETKAPQQAEVAEQSPPVQVIKRELSFTLNQTEDRVVIEVIDAENDEVIRRIPADDVSKLEETLGSLKGVFVDSKV